MERITSVLCYLLTSLQFCGVTRLKAVSSQVRSDIFIKNSRNVLPDKENTMEKLFLTLKRYEQFNPFLFIRGYPALAVFRQH